MISVNGMLLESYSDCLEFHGETDGTRSRDSFSRLVAHGVTKVKFCDGIDFKNCSRIV